MRKARLNVIDVSFAMQAQTRRRNRDGIHWSSASNRLCIMMMMVLVLTCYDISRLMTNITLTHLTLTLPLSGPHCLPGMMKDSVSLTNLIRLKTKKQRKSSSSRRSFEFRGYSNSPQQTYDWSGGSPWSGGYNPSGYSPSGYSPSGYSPSGYPSYYYSSPWSQSQQRQFNRRNARRLRNRSHPYQY